MNRSPIPRVLSSFRRRRARALLMGGQACILYGAAEFSRDIDFAVDPAEANLDRLRAALRDLGAETVYFPPLGREALERGHACHFRCGAPGLHDLRIDLMSVMRGVDPFPRLWDRRVEIPLPDMGSIAVMALPDLVAAKKTQRDKDWPMVRRLIEADVAASRGSVPARRASLWLAECRTPELLVRLVGRFPRLAERLAPTRAAIRAARRGRSADVARALRAEEDQVRREDARYWQPLRSELERMRRARSRPG